MAKRIYGIDLGTTYSCIAYGDESGKPVVCPNADSELITPSAVYFESPGNVLVGKEAKNSSKAFPDQVIQFIKRDMGNPDYQVHLDGHTYTPEQISSLILRKLVGDAEQQMDGEKITDVVITCPAYFGDAERKATKAAGALAGLNVRDIINEPTAAALCYGMLNSGMTRNVLVYDLGGGTFDVTVIRVDGNDIQVVCTGGDHRLGGKDWDDRIACYLGERFMEEHPDAGDPVDDAGSSQEIAITAEEIKRSLSTKETVKRAISHNGKRANVEVTRQAFEAMTQELLERTIDMTRELLQTAASEKIRENVGCDCSKIDRILLVGGSSRMPAVMRRVKDEFGGEIHLYDPDQAVAKGAALYGLQKMIMDCLPPSPEAAGPGLPSRPPSADEIKEVGRKLEEQAGITLTDGQIRNIASTRVRNVCSRGFGIAARRDRTSDALFVSFLIHRQTPLPVTVTRRYSTSYDDQSEVHLEIYEQNSPVENDDLAASERIQDGTLAFPPDLHLPEGAPLDVTFQMGTDGTIVVTAQEPTSGAKLTLTVTVHGASVEEQRKAVGCLTVS